jgi:X-Pro dipeptidyl-peptidase
VVHVEVIRPRAPLNRACVFLLSTRLAYATGAIKAPVRFSGRARAGLRVSFSRPAANVTALLVDRAPDGTGKIITRGWTDPQNRLSPWVTMPITPGREYSVEVQLEPKDYVFAAGHRIEFVLMSSDYDYTLRPQPGAGITLDVRDTEVALRSSAASGRRGTCSEEKCDFWRLDWRVGDGEGC